MRTTVGPLPSTVYWRRRAVVLGALLLGVLILFLSCSGNDPAKRRGAGDGGSVPSANVDPLDSPKQTTSFSDDKPGGGPALPDPADLTGGATAGATAGIDPAGTPGGGPTNGPGVNTTGGASTGPNVPVNVPNGQCADAEMSVTPVPARTATKRGTPVEIRLKIKNISTRTCPRDVGADLQEIYVKQGARLVWSSDICSTVKGSDLEPFAPGAEREYGVTWNGRDSSRCATGLAVGPVPTVGVYQVFGRLGGKVSEPVSLALTA